MLEKGGKKEKTGEIKRGFGTLIGNAGEYYVVAELLKRNVIAALAPRNAPGFDILATRKSKTTKIRVKTKSEGYDMWQYSAKKDGKTIFRELSNKEYQFFLCVASLTCFLASIISYLLTIVSIILSKAGFIKSLLFACTIG